MYFQLLNAGCGLPIPVLCNRQLMNCKAAWSYIPFCVFQVLCYVPNSPVTGCSIVLLLDPEGWLDRCGTVWQV